MGRKNYWSQVAVEMATFVRDHGFSVVENFVGHGIGRDMHEEPQVPNFLARSSAATATSAWSRAWSSRSSRWSTWAPRRSKASPTIGRKSPPTAARRHFEHTVAITDRGPWVLTAPPTPEELAAPPA